MTMAIKLTEEQRQALPDEIETEAVEVTDDGGRRFYLVSEAVYGKLKMLMQSEEIDPSLYEFEEPHEPT